MVGYYKIPVFSGSVLAFIITFRLMLVWNSSQVPRNPNSLSRKLNNNNNNNNNKSTFKFSELKCWKRNRLILAVAQFVGCVKNRIWKEKRKKNRIWRDFAVVNLCQSFHSFPYSKLKLPKRIFFSKGLRIEPLKSP